MRKAAGLVPLAVFAGASLCALAGLDFGHHWDEYKHLEPAARSVLRGSYLPERYIYPSLCYDLILLAAAAHVPAALPADGGARERLYSLALSRPFKLRVRALFALLTLLSSLWTYLIVLRWRGDPLEAALACALVGFSWEVNYHARWIAPDGLVMQLGALTTLGVVCSFDGRHRARRLLLAAVAAGLACSAKYPAGLLLLPVLLAAGRNNGLTLLSAFAAAYLAATPGTLLDMGRFIADVREELRVYALGHLGYTVSGPVEHLALSLVWLGRSAFTRYPEVSLFFAGLAPLGAAALLREGRRRAAVFLSFPVLYLAYFSLQKVMIVRNLLVLLPFLAVLAAAGWSEVRRRLPRPSYRVLFTGATALFLLLELGWLARSAASIRAPGEDVPGLAAYIDARPGTRFLLSRGAAAALSDLDSRRRENVVAAPGSGAELAVLFASEVDGARWTANRPGYVRTWFGPYEVNFDYYPTWQGRDRLLVMPTDRVVGLGPFEAAP